MDEPLLDFAKLATPPVSRYMYRYGMIPEGYLIGSTGHRPEDFRGVYSLVQAKPAMEVIGHALLDLAEARQQELLEGGLDPEERFVVISGMGPGFDQWVAGATLWLKKEGHPFELWMIIPWKGFDFPRYFAENRPWIAQMREKALKVSELTDIKIDSGDRKAQLAMLHDRNNEVALFSRKAVMGWSGKEEGGTWDTLCRMRKRGLEPLNLYDEVMAALAPSL